MLALYHNDMSLCAQKVRVGLAEKKLDWESRHLVLRAAEHQQPWYLELNRRAVVPTLIDGEKVIPESNVILEYLDEAYPNPALAPLDAYGRARMRLWTKQLDEDVHDAATRKHLGLGNFLAADSDRTTHALLQHLHIDGFVHLAVAAMAHAMRFGVLAHLPDVSLERVEIEDQAWRLDVAFIHARHGGNVITDFEVGKIRLRIHGISALASAQITRQSTFFSGREFSAVNFRWKDGAAYGKSCAGKRFAISC